MPEWFKREIIHTPTREPDIEGVKHVQRVLRVAESGEMDENTRMAIRGMQMLFGLKVTGTVNEETAEEIDRIVPLGAW